MTSIPQSAVSRTVVATPVVSAVPKATPTHIAKLKQLCSEPLSLFSQRENSVGLGTGGALWSTGR